MICYMYSCWTLKTMCWFTFDEGFPRDLLGVNDVQPEEAFHIQALQTEDDTIQDIAVPVLGGKAGMIRLGMSESAIDAAVAGNIRNMLLWFTLILVLGLSVAYGLASILTGISTGEETTIRLPCPISSEYGLSSHRATGSQAPKIPES